MKALLGIALTLAPFFIEFAIDATRTLSFNRTDRHWLTGSLRLLFIFIAGIANPLTVYWWQGSLLAFAFHYLLFDACFNHYVLHKPVSYFGKNIIDRIHAWLERKISFEGLIFFRIALFAISVQLYINPCIHYDCIPF